MFLIIVDIGYVRAMLGDRRVEWFFDCLRARFPNASTRCFDGGPGRLARGMQTRIAQRSRVKLRMGDLVDNAQLGVDELIIRELKSLARGENPAHLLLISGDSDFLGPLGGAKEEGIRVSLVAIRSGATTNQSRRLRDVADKIWVFSSNEGFEAATF